MKKKGLLYFYSLSFVLSCFLFTTVCYVNLGVKTDNLTIFIVHAGITNGLILSTVFAFQRIYFIYINKPIHRSWVRILLASLLGLFFFCLCFYANNYAVAELPNHLVPTRKSANPYFAVVENKIFYEQSLLHYFVLFFWVGLFGMAEIALNKYFKSSRALHKMQESYTQSRLAMIKNKMSPHFLFNELNNIYSLMVLDHPETQNYLKRSLHLSESIIGDKYNLSSNLNDEMSDVLNYLELQKIRFAQDLNVLVNRTKTLPDITVPSMSLLTLVENAIKHFDFNQDIDGYHIILDSFLQESNYVFRIRNRFNTNNRKKTGLGISQLRKRLDEFFVSNYSLSNAIRGNIYQSELIIEITK